MRLVLRPLPQMVVMAAIVTSALFVPVGALLIWLAYALFGVSLPALVTFGSLLTALEGLLAWWALLFFPALAYAACVMPWSARE